MALVHKIAQKFLNKANATLPRLKGTIGTSIAFIHIPKCGGTSIHSAISQHYRADKVSYLDPTASRTAAKAADVPMLPFRRSLLDYELAKQDGLRFVSGHWPVDQEMVQRNAEHWSFVTILRDPVERWLSNYFFNRHRADNREHFGTSLSLGAYLDTKDAVENGKLYLSFAHGGDMPEGDLTEKISQAVDVFGNFALVGHLDRMDGFLDAFQALWNIRLNIPVSNVNPANKAVRDETLTPALLQRIEELCGPDRLIYEAVCSSKIETGT